MNTKIKNISIGRSLLKGLGLWISKDMGKKKSDIITNQNHTTAAEW